MKKNRNKKRKGSALATTLGVMTLLALASATYLDNSTSTVRNATRNLRSTQTTHLCEAGLQSVQRGLWRPFRSSQKFTDMKAQCENASVADPKAVKTGSIDGIGKYISGVIAFNQVNNYMATVKIRSIGYLDRNNNNVLDNGEPFRQVDSTSRYELARSQVFDYTYFINNYGWMDGFGVNDLLVNGDMRANGNFDFLNGSPTVNGTVIACANDKLDPKVPGYINTPPVKWTDATYTSNWNNSSVATRSRWRPPYDSTKFGAVGTSNFNKWRDMVFSSNGSWVNGHTLGGNFIPPGSFGAVMADSKGMNAWDRTSVNGTLTKTLLDSKPTKEVVMPDLSDINKYKQLSKDFGEKPSEFQKQYYSDGTANPNYGQKATLEVWDSAQNKYVKLTNSDGQISGSAVIVGTSDKPIKLYGPVTVDQDVVIKGYISGQGALYSGRNVHIVGSVRYKNPPSWLGNNPTSIDHANEKCDMVGFAARGSVMMGNPTTFGYPYPLYYMMPPFTHGRYDDNGVYIPAFNANDVDASGRKKYQSVVADSIVNAMAEGVNQIDGILYTNYVGGGNVGTSGTGVVFNGTIVSKDESIVTWSLPIIMNYDNRVRERGPDEPPLIDLNLPRQPTLMRSTWQDKGYYDTKI